MRFLKEPLSTSSAREREEERLRSRRGSSPSSRLNPLISCLFFRRRARPFLRRHSFFLSGLKDTRSRPVNLFRSFHFSRRERRGEGISLFNSFQEPQSSSVRRIT